MHGRIREALKLRAGDLLGRLLPHRRRAVEVNPLAPDLPPLDRLIRKHLVQRAIDRHDHAALSRYHQAYWQDRAAGHFFANTQDRFERWFLGAHRPLVDRLVERTEADPSLGRLYEVGCGAGQALEHLAGRLPTLERLVGVDLNAQQIARNSARPRDPRVDYAAAPALDWILAHATAGCVLFANGGVLEYFAPEDVTRLYRHAATLAPCVVALIEPIAPGFDPAREASRIFGDERSFSHPHPVLLEAAGFTVRFAEDTWCDGHRLLMVLADTHKGDRHLFENKGTGSFGAVH